MSIIQPSLSPVSLETRSLLQPTNARPTSALLDGPLLPEQEFTGVLKSMLLDVNKAQKSAMQLANGFERHDHQDLASVMIAQQKARLAFQTTLQVRNKLVSAYQDVMNMPV